MDVFDLYINVKFLMIGEFLIYVKDFIFKEDLIFFNSVLNFILVFFFINIRFFFIKLLNFKSALVKCLFKCVLLKFVCMLMIEMFFWIKIFKIFFG